MSAIEQYASALEKVLPTMGSWRRETSTLVGGSAPLFAQGLRAALLLVPGDDIKAGRVRIHLDQLVAKANGEIPTRGGGPPVPWAQLIVLYVFENGASPEMRTFVGNDRRVVSSKQVIQGGWVDLKSKEASFRTSRTPFETELMGLMQQAVTGSSERPLSSARAAANAAAAAAKKTAILPVDKASTPETGEPRPRPPWAPSSSPAPWPCSPPCWPSISSRRCAMAHCR